MTLAVIASRTLSGLHAHAVRVETHLGPGLPSFNVVGLPDTEVRESRERVRAAILNSGFNFPAGRITVNLSPADIPKESGRFDLPIALGLLLAAGQLAPREEGAREEGARAGGGGKLAPWVWGGAFRGGGVGGRGRGVCRRARSAGGRPGAGGRIVVDGRAGARLGSPGDRAERGAGVARRHAHPARRQRRTGGLGRGPAGAVGPQPGGCGGSCGGRLPLAGRHCGELAGRAAGAVPVGRARPARCAARP